jgi:hypothetical protein
VKRPGVDVRARKGYRAATAKEVSAAKAAAAAPAGEAASALNAAMSSLARIRPDSRLNLNAVALRPAGALAVSSLLVAGELPSVSGADSLRAGGTVDITVSASGRSTTAQVTLAPGDRSFAVPVTLPGGYTTGTLDVRARMTGPDPSVAGLAGNITIDPAGGDAQPMLFRRGPTTGNRVVPAATFLFSRTERARFEFAIGADAKPGTARLLDRGGQPLAIPVTVSERTDDKTGQRWVAADITLAALAAGDYAIEISMSGGQGTERLLAALRVGR